MALPVEEVWVNNKVVKITLKNARDKPGIAAQIFERLAEIPINVELIVQGPSIKGKADIAFLILESQIPMFEEVKDELMDNIGATDIKMDKGVAILVFQGDRGLSKRPGIAAKIFDLIAQAGVNIEMISTSSDSLSLVIREDRLDDTLEVLQEELGIEATWEY